jgi:sporulation protein YlmC with PRC-barrel domain
LKLATRRAGYGQLFALSFESEVAMVEGTPFTIGAEAVCTDGVCGQVSQVVVDPLEQTLTHLVVEPSHRAGLGRLVPLDLVETGSGEVGTKAVHLRCTVAEFDQLPGAERTDFLPGVEGATAYGADQTLLWPYFGGNTTVPVTFDTLPVGEVAVRRGEGVHAADGHIGEVEGLVFDRVSRRVSHLLLKEGHLWGRKEVAIPISAVRAVDEDGIRLTISKREVQDLPAVELEKK